MVSRNPGISPYSPRTRATSASSGGIGPRFGDSESTFVLQPALDLAELLFTGPQHRGAAMYRVLAEHEVVGVRSRRPKNELRIGVRMEVDRVCGRLEDRQFTGLQAHRNKKAARAQRDPANRMVDGRLVAPELASSQAHSEIVQRRWGFERTPGRAAGPDENTRRAVARHGLRRQVHVFDLPEFLVRRQREPELETTGMATVAGSAAVPRPMSRLEPFNAACRQDASRSGRIFVTDASLEQVCHRRDP